MATKTRHYLPPVIPEIAQAYKNDPKTALALAALKSGTSTAPVATGGYGVAEGIARALQGAMGGYQSGKQNDTYGAEEAAKVAAMNASGVANGGGNPPPTSVDPSTGLISPGAPRNDDYAGATGNAQQPDNYAQAAQVAATLDPSTAPATGAVPPSALPGHLTAPVPPPGPPMAAAAPPVAPGVGGGPGGQPPFVAAAATPPVVRSASASDPYHFKPEAVPEGPAPVARPEAPQAIGATRSRLLDKAYALMAHGDRYDYARAQDLETQGLTDQTKLDETATERKQKIIDDMSAMDRQVYAHASEADRDAIITARAAVQRQNFEGAQHAGDHVATAREGDLNRSNALTLEGMRARSAMAVAKVHEASKGGASGLTPEEQDALNKAAGEGRVDAMRLTGRQMKTLAGVFISNPGFNAMSNHAYAQLMANAPAQQKAMLVGQLPAVLDNVREAGAKLKFSNLQPVGRLQGFVKGFGNDPDYINYMTQRNDAMLALANAMSGVGASDMRAKMESEAAPKTMSPKAWEGWYDGQMKALQPRIDAYTARGLLPGATPGNAPPAAASTKKKTGNALVDKYL